MSAPDYDELDPGIRDVVRWLRGHGFQTCDSGDGISKSVEWYVEGEALAEPHVFMVVPVDQIVAEARRLRTLVESELGLVVTQPGEIKIGVTIEASYEPVSDLAIVGLFGVVNIQIESRASRN